MAKPKDWTGTGYLYLLSDGRHPDRVRYVGITTQEPNAYNLRRFRWWGSSKRSPSSHLQCWLRSLSDDSAELVVSVTELSSVSWLELAQAEIMMIAEQRAAGADLVNSTDGGDGLLGHSAPRTSEWSSKISSAVKQAYVDDPGLAARVQEARQLSMLERYGTLSTQQFKTRSYPSPQKGKPWTAEQKAKASASHKARWAKYRETGQDAEVRAAISAGTKQAMQRSEVKERTQRGFAEYNAQRPRKAKPVVAAEDAWTAADQSAHSRSVWSNMTPEQRTERGKKIAEGRRKAKEARARDAQ